MTKLDNLKILVVDDMATSRGLLVRALEEIGFKHVDWVRSAEEAIESLSKSAVHMIVSDQNMPGMTGLQLLHRIRTDPNASKTAFILVTGSPDPRILQEGVKMNLNNFIKKPFSTAQMKACIEKVWGALS